MANQLILLAMYDLTKQILNLLDRKDTFFAESVDYSKEDVDGIKNDVITLAYIIQGIDQDRDYDIRNTELIKIYITENKAPIVEVLRTDFPPVPHLNINDKKPFKTICYSDLEFPDIQDRLNGQFLLICINNWFVKTACNELHQENQPLEPYFPYVNSNLVIAGSQSRIFTVLRSVKTGASSFLVEESILPKPYDDDIKIYAIIVLPPRIFSADNLIHQLPMTIYDLHTFMKTNLSCIFLEWFEQVLSIKRNPDVYKILFHQTESKLLAVRTMLIVQIPLSRDNVSAPDRNDLKAFLIDAPLKELMASFGAIVNKKKHKSSYHYKKEENTGGSKINLIPYNVLWDSTSDFLGIINGYTGGNMKKIAMIGVGALGSQVLVNCARAGYGKWYIIDNDVFYPHNISRHALTREFIGYKKTDGLCVFVKRIAVDFKITSSSQDIFEADEECINHLHSADIIIDTSASIAVERHIALSIKSDSRRVSFFVNPSGNCSVMLLEDIERTRTLDLLEMQYYLTLLQDERLYNHLRTPERIVFSGTCRSITSRVSQDDIAFSAAYFCKKLKQIEYESDSKIAFLLHNEICPEYIAIKGESWQCRKEYGWDIFIREYINEILFCERKNKLPNETGGVLIGTFDYKQKRLYMVDLIDSPDDSIESPNSYIRGCAGLEKRVTEIMDITAGNLKYIGEWHSHPGTRTEMSSDDRILFSTIARALKNGPFFIKK